MNAREELTKEIERLEKAIDKQRKLLGRLDDFEQKLLGQVNGKRAKRARKPKPSASEPPVPPETGGMAEYDAEDEKLVERACQTSQPLSGVAFVNQWTVEYSRGVLEKLVSAGKVIRSGRGRGVRYLWRGVEFKG